MSRSSWTRTLPGDRRRGPGTGSFFQDLHTAHGTALLLGQGVAGFHGDGDGRVRAVGTADGRVLPADLVLVGVGAAPRTELAEAAGLLTDERCGGVVTDERLLTADPAISAVGDCAAHPDARTGRRVRLESVQNAAGHARLVADRLTGSPRAYDDLPWFWSDQFTASLQIAGAAHEHDTSVVLEAEPDAFSVLLFHRGRLVAVESVDRPGDHMAARQLLSRGLPLGPEQAAAPGFSLKEHFRTARTAAPVPAAA
ncbi:NAD(P)/FAD-dependent oxidoreductase [Streptomyces gamaensis]|uniref:NAD(P)/FAD-dependent oxidoreductase n=1 Tax=Streptomyces gamaensis TaxID=1763542 RepID=A0ABW0Z8I7_9ACTN